MQYYIGHIKIYKTEAFYFVPWVLDNTAEFVVERRI